MAEGDFTVFDQYLDDVFTGGIHTSSNTYKAGLVTSAVTPAADDAAPHFNGTGTTDYSANEVTPGGNYSAGGPAITGWTLSITANDLKVDINDVEIATDGSNPTNARYLVVYNDTDANKRGVGFVDLGSVRDLSSGSFAYRPPANGLFRVGPGTIT